MALDRLVKCPWQFVRYNSYSYPAWRGSCLRNLSYFHDTTQSYRKGPNKDLFNQRTVCWQLRHGASCTSIYLQIYFLSKFSMRGRLVCEHTSPPAGEMQTGGKISSLCSPRLHSGAIWVAHLLWTYKVWTLIWGDKHELNFTWKTTLSYVWVVPL